MTRRLSFGLQKCVSHWSGEGRIGEGDKRFPCRSDAETQFTVAGAKSHERWGLFVEPN
jgi:hypothetical protein